MKDDDDTDFADMVPGVRRLRHDRVNLYRHRGQHKPGPRRPAAEARAPQPASSAGLAPQRESWFDSGLQKKLQRRIRQGLIRPEASLDLHGYRSHQALELLPRFIEQAQQRGLRMVIVIHGQGFRSQSDAVLKPLVQRWLADCPGVLAWCPAQPRDGAAGASYVYLRGGA